MRIHIISIGGRIMHNLALDLKKKGNLVTGSDDEIYEPSRSKLRAENLLPSSEGWDEDRITKDIDIVILGMHAKKANPEIAKALKLGLTIMSYPEFIANETKIKKRVVVAGSHGKTTTTSMIMHVLKYHGVDFDYLVGAELDGFDSMIRLTDADLIVIEGDEYLSSALDSRPKMLHYDPDLAVITGIEWDHINVFPSSESYLKQFEIFINLMRADTKLFFFENDDVLLKLALDIDAKVERISYLYFPHDKRGDLLYNDEKYKTSIFGLHNLANMEAAHKICIELGITSIDFINAIQFFKGAAKRLELLSEVDDFIVYRDFAHAPSKVKASTQAVKSKHKFKNLTAILELHTYSSLNKSFLPNYKNTLDAADQLIVYFNENTLKIKGMPELSEEFIQSSFKHPNMIVINQSEELENKVLALKNSGVELLLLMSSGNFGEIDLSTII